jgi:hypothetical protein
MKTLASDLINEYLENQGIETIGEAQLAVADIVFRTVPVRLHANGGGHVLDALKSALNAIVTPKKMDSFASVLAALEEEDDWDDEE